eukprot:1137945-Pelagomonas_calceolata.AAC.6
MCKYPFDRTHGNARQRKRQCIVISSEKRNMKAELQVWLCCERTSKPNTAWALDCWSHHW